MRKLVLFAVLCLLFPLTGLAQEEQQESQQRINKRNLTIKEWNTDARGGHKMLDHVTTYNADGRKLEEIEYNADGQKWRKRYEYDATGTKLVKEYVYDGRNRLQTCKKIEYNPLGRKKVQYTYDPKGKLISIKHYEYIAQETD